MQTATFQPQVLVFPHVGINYQAPVREQKKVGEEVSILFKSLAEKGLDRLTAAKIEHVICTPALSAHI